MPVDMLVLHYTGMRSAAEALDRLRDPAAGVSAHYVVETDGLVWRMVPEARRAAHAGVSSWRGRSGINDRSIGVEIVNPGHEHGYMDFPALQMAAVCELCLGILGRHPILARDVVAHSDIAWNRKQDPGERFDWRGLAANGVGLWPHSTDSGTGPASDGEPAARAALSAIGYRIDAATPIGPVLTAFQRHWRPEAITGALDLDTLARLLAVRRLCGE